MFNDEIARWSRKMEVYFDLADHAKARQDEIRESQHRQTALLIGDFIKSLEDLKWEYT